MRNGLRSAMAFYALIAGLILMAMFPAQSAAGTTPVTNIIREKGRFDGQEIEIQGEVVGDVMHRRGGSWLNIDDGTESIGVWVPAGMLPRIDVLGGYSSCGDSLRIAGVFCRACPMHGGETDIHALKVVRIQKGNPLPHPISGQKLQWALLLLCLALITGGIYWRRNRGQEKDR